MIRFFQGAVLALILVPSAETAQDFDAGLATAQADDFATALREWTPLAKHGDRPRDLCRAILTPCLGRPLVNFHGDLENSQLELLPFRGKAES